MGKDGVVVVGHGGGLRLGSGRSHPNVAFNGL